MSSSSRRRPTQPTTRRKRAFYQREQTSSKRCCLMPDAQGTIERTPLTKQNAPCRQATNEATLAPPPPRECAGFNSARLVFVLANGVHSDVTNERHQLLIHCSPQTSSTLPNSLQLWLPKAQAKEKPANGPRIACPESCGVCEDHQHLFRFNVPCAMLIQGSRIGPFRYGDGISNSL